MILQSVTAIFLILSILIQERGSGLSEAIAGTGASSFQSTKRGAEKFLNKLTIFLFIVFLAFSLALNFI